MTVTFQGWNQYTDESGTPHTVVWTPGQPPLPIAEALRQAAVERARAIGVSIPASLRDWWLAVAGSGNAFAVPMFPASGERTAACADSGNDLHLCFGADGNWYCWANGEAQIGYTADGRVATATGRYWSCATQAGDYTPSAVTMPSLIVTGPHSPFAPARYQRTDVDIEGDLTLTGYEIDLDGR